MSNRYRKNEEGIWVNFHTGETIPSGNYKFVQYTDGTIAIQNADEDEAAAPAQTKPRACLLKGSELAGQGQSYPRFSPSDSLEVSSDGKTIAWVTPMSASWLRAPTDLRLHSGSFDIEFTVDEMSSGQIGIGFLLDWSVGPDW